MKMELRKTFQFEAAHLLPHLPKTHKCRRLHGHSFAVEVVVAGECDPKLGWLMGASIVFSLALMYAVGALIERGLLRPLQNAPHISLTMMTVALSYLLKGLSRFFYGREVVPLPPILAGDPIEFFDIVLAPQDLLIVLFSLFVVLVAYWFFNYTRSGKVIQAASQTPRGAALVGINVPRLRNIMWGVGAMLGAMAGILIAPTTLVYPDMGGHVLIRAFAAMTLGGFGSLPGAVIGSMSLGVIENLLGGYVSSALVEISAYLVIIAVLIVRPQGIMGEWRQGRG